MAPEPIRALHYDYRIGQLQLSIGITNQSELRWPQVLEEGNMLVSDQLLIRSCPLAGPSDSVRLKSYCVKSPAQLWI